MSLKSEDERRDLARTLVSLRFPIDNPGFDISATVDEPVERVALADFYNGPGAAWVRANSSWEWLPLDASELRGVSTVRDFGRLCFAHLQIRVTPAPPAGDLQ